MIYCRLCHHWSHYRGGEGPHQAHCYLYPRDQCLGLLYPGTLWSTGHSDTTTPTLPCQVVALFSRLSMPRNG